ncbi:hypothetical protein EDD15DRAFT_2368021 [Pisolithus albus]|nr:hypothetical protein EDD15DRAFT_2368021 [Pisolithus albus]
MTTSNSDVTPQLPLSPTIDSDHTHTLLRELSASMGIAPDSEEGLATLQAFIRSSRATARSATTPPP